MSDERIPGQALLAADELVLDQFDREYEAATTDEERKAIHTRLENFMRQRSPEGHKSGHKDFFGQRQELIIPSRENEEVDAVDRGMDANISEALKHARTRQVVKRAIALPGVVMDALVNRVQDPTVPGVLKCKFDEWTRIQQDELYEPASKYIRNLLFTTNSRGEEVARPVPLRQLLENEVGVLYNDKSRTSLRIVVVTSMPGDKGLKTFQVSANLEKKDA